MAEVSDRGIAPAPRVSTADLGVGLQALERLRETTYDLVDVTPSVAPEEFRTSGTNTLLTTGLLIDTRFSAARLTARPRTSLAAASTITCCRCISRGKPSSPLVVAPQRCAPET